MKPIILSPIAELEIISSANYYREKSTGLEHFFLDTIKESIIKIQSHPERYPIIEENIRRMVILKFPYNIYFKIHPNEIHVLSIGHQKRKPGYWKKSPYS